MDQLLLQTLEEESQLKTSNTDIDKKVLQLFRPTSKDAFNLFQNKMDLQFLIYW